MENKKDMFEMPVAEVIEFDNADVVTESAFDDNEGSFVPYDSGSN